MIMAEFLTLYHASANPDITEFEPREESSRYPGEGPLVFATPDKRVAAMFLAPKDGGLAEISKFDEDAVLVIQNSADNFIAHDKGGAIYVLPSDTFTTDNSIGMQETEWVSKEAVKPISKEIYTTSIDAMRSMGVKLYFVDARIMNMVRNSSDHGMALLRSLPPYLS